MEDNMVRLDEFNMDDSIKPVKFKTKDNKYFIKKYKKVLFYNNNNIKNNFIDNELLLKDIKHPNLIEIIKEESTHVNSYIYFKYYNIQDLLNFSILNNRNKLELYFFNKKIITQLLNVVYFLHKNNIVHRDIKIDNILYDEMRNKIYLCDYEYCTDNIYDNHLVGTSCYSPPEIQNRTRNINYKKVDIWCLGIVFFIILSKGQLLEISEFLKPKIVKSYILENEYNFISTCLDSNPLNRLEAKELLELEYLK